jgi:hypothetical protein
MGAEPHTPSCARRRPAQRTHHHQPPSSQCPLSIHTHRGHEGVRPVLQVHQEAHVHHKLAQQGGEDVEAEDAGVGARLAAGSGQRGQGKGSRGGLVAAARLACASTGLRVSTRERIQAGRPHPCHEDCRPPARPPAHLMRSRGCAWLMKKNMPAVSTPARVACRRRSTSMARQSAHMRSWKLTCVCVCMHTLRQHQPSRLAPTAWPAHPPAAPFAHTPFPPTQPLPKDSPACLPA